MEAFWKLSAVTIGFKSRTPIPKHTAKGSKHYICDFVFLKKDILQQKALSHQYISFSDNVNSSICFSITICLHDR